MSVKVKTGWLKDKDGEKFAPKTLSSQVQTSDGLLLEEKLNEDLKTLKEEVIEDVKASIDGTSNLECTEEDNGKFLRVINGKPTWSAISNAEEVAY